METCTRANQWLLRLCSDTSPEHPEHTEQHPSDTEQRFWTGSIGSIVRGGADGTW
jgi:hypothetical protein